MISYLKDNWRELLIIFIIGIILSPLIIFIHNQTHDFYKPKGYGYFPKTREPDCIRVSWDKVKAGDTIYLVTEGKNSFICEPITK